MHDQEAMLTAHAHGRQVGRDHASVNALVATEHLRAMARDSYGYRTDDERDAFVAGYMREAFIDSQKRKGVQTRT